MTLRIIFMGTPDFSVPTLAEVMAAGHDVVAVYCQPPRPAGRGMAERKSPVHRFAEAAGLQVLTPKTLRSAQAQETFRSHAADAAVVVAYGLILPQDVLNAPRFGCFNLHASALPRWRGAAPIQRAVMAGDAETAATVMRMEEGLDTGPVCLAERVPIGPNMTAGDLHDELARRGASLMVRALAALERGSLTETPQPQDGVTYAAKIDKAEARIAFDRPAREVHNQIRGLSPFPGAWLEIAHDGRQPERIKVLRSELVESQGAHRTPGTVLDDALTVACGEGALRLVRLQRPGRKVMAADELLRGFELPAGTVLNGGASPE
ncbi:MAG: methionyl-tRNA formyltransferase [Hyphomicrobiaceae bacterium]